MFDGSFRFIELNLGTPESNLEFKGSVRNLLKQSL